MTSGGGFELQASCSPMTAVCVVCCVCMCVWCVVLCCVVLCCVVLCCVVLCCVVLCCVCVCCVVLCCVVLCCVVLGCVCVLGMLCVCVGTSAVLTFRYRDWLSAALTFRCQIGTRPSRSDVWCI